MDSYSNTTLFSFFTLYLKNMEALIPHKDILLTLSKIQKDFILNWNRENPEDCIFPVYPLWAFSESFGSGYKSAVFTSIKTENSTADFVLLLDDGNSTEEKRITFGKFLRGQKKAAGETIPAAFPLRMKSFRTGTDIYSRNCHRFFNEKWHKCL